MTHVIIIAMMLIIAFTLGSGLFYLVRDQGQSNRTVKMLTWRIGLSISLFLLLFIAFAAGLIQPHGL